MKTISSILIGIILLPVVGNALVSNTDVSVHTGGQTSVGGQSVSSGQSSASSEVRTILRGNSGGGRVFVEVRTESDGEVEIRQQDMVLPPSGGSVHIDVPAVPLNAASRVVPHTEQSPKTATRVEATITNETQAEELRQTHIESDILFSILRELGSSVAGTDDILVVSDTRAYGLTSWISVVLEAPKRLFHGFIQRFISIG